MSEPDPQPPLTVPSWAERVRRVDGIALFHKYRRRLVHRETELPLDPSPRGSQAYTFEALAFETGWGMRLALNVFMPVCATVFAVSFLWDWHGLLRSCGVAGMIGFATNWVAIKMLFWPRESRPVFGQGLIPSQRDQLVEKVADEVLNNLINEELILQRIEDAKLIQRLSTSAIERLGLIVRDDEFKDDLRSMILTWVADLTQDPAFRARLTERAETSLETFAGEGMRSWMVKRLRATWRPSLVRWVNQELQDLDQTVTEGLGHLDELVERFPEALAERQESIDRVLSRMLLGLVREVDVRAIVVDQLATVTTEQLERGFKEFSDDKLSFITLLGGVLGVVGGTVIVWPLPSLAVLSAAAVALFVVDRAAKPLMESRFWPRRRATARAKGSAPPEPPSQP